MNSKSLSIPCEPAAFLAHHEQEEEQHKANDHQDREGRSSHEGLLPFVVLKGEATGA